MLRIIIICCLLAAAFPGCKKYLNVKTDAGLISPRTLRDLQMLLDDSYIMNFSGPSLGEASADDYFLTTQVYQSMDENYRNIYTWRNFAYQYPNDWARAYLPVYNCNLVLERLADIERSEYNRTQYDYIKASALFYRAYQFLALSWTFAKAYDPTTASADAGIVLRTSIDPAVISVRSSVADCYEKIITDIHSAISGLPEQPSHPMRPSLPAAYGLLARTYLSTANYDSALYYAENALNISGELMDFNDPNMVDLSGLFPFSIFNKETIFHAQMITAQPTISMFISQTDSALHDSYDINDLRSKAYFNPRGMYFNFKGTYAQSFLDYFSGIATDELYLIKAECKARLNNVPGAMQDLNDLLRTRFVTGTFADLTAGSTSEALTIILSERRKELLMRGLRWIDIKRLNVAGESISVKRIVDGQEFILPPNDNRFAVPLPDDIIKMTGIEQNT